MKHAKVLNGVVLLYPYTYSELFAENPSTSFAVKGDESDLNKWYQDTEDAASGARIAVVTETAKPSFDEDTQTCTEGTPVRTAGVWNQVWVVADKPAPDVAIGLQERQRKRIQAIKAAVQKRLDDFAQTKHYDGILDACSYKGTATLAYRNQAAYCMDMRDAYWVYTLQAIQDIKNNVRPLPTVAAFLTELPTLTWP